MIVVKHNTKINSIKPSANFVRDKILVASPHTRHPETPPECFYLIDLDGSVEKIPSDTEKFVYWRAFVKPKDSIVLPEEYKSARPIVIHKTNYGHAVLRSRDCLAIDFSSHLLHRMPLSTSLSNLAMSFGHGTMSLLCYLPDIFNPQGNQVLIFGKDRERYSKIVFFNSHKTSSFTIMYHAVARSSKFIFVCSGANRKIIRIVDVESLEVVNEFQISHPVYALAVSLDDTVLACVGLCFTTHLDI